MPEPLDIFHFTKAITPAHDTTIMIDRPTMKEHDNTTKILQHEAVTLAAVLTSTLPRRTLEHLAWLLQPTREANDAMNGYQDDLKNRMACASYDSSNTAEPLASFHRGMGFGLLAASNEYARRLALHKEHHHAEVPHA